VTFQDRNGREFKNADKWMEALRAHPLAQANAAAARAHVPCKTTQQMEGSARTGDRHLAQRAGAPQEDGDPDDGSPQGS